MSPTRDLLTKTGPGWTWSRRLPADLAPEQSASGVTRQARRKDGRERIWSINGRFLTQPLTGVQRYAREIVRALDQLCLERHPLTDHVRLEILHPRGAPQVSGLGAISQWPIGNLGDQLWEQALLPVHVKGGLLSLCNVGPLAVAKQVVCIHDVNTRKWPESYTWQFRALYRLLLPALGWRAAQVTTVSNYTAAQLETYGVAASSKILVIPNGHEHALKWQDNPLPSSSVHDADTIVLLGSPAPHKNVRRVLSLASHLAVLGLKIAVVGASDGRVFSDLGPVPDAPNIRWLGRLSDEALAQLLREALCLAFPSYVEGFGLPPLEAMSLGCPVVVSDCASLPEVCGDAALYAAPNDGAAWLHAFKRLRTEPGLRAQLAAAGLARARRFTWRQSAERYLEIMARLDGVA